MPKKTNPSPIQRVKPGELGDFLKKTRQAGRITSAMERHLAVCELDTSRRQDVLHPSEVVKDDACIRESVYRIRNAREGLLPDFERPGLRLQTIFDVGNATHERWQNRLGEVGMMWGYWRCLGCNCVTGPSTRSPWPCGFCGHQAKTYVEITLQHGLFAGHTDGWLKWQTADPDSLLEIKTVGTGTIRAYDPGLLLDNDDNLEKAFRSLRRPFRDHRRQVMTYLWLSREMYADRTLDEKPPKDAVVLYECKANQALKEFTVAYDEDLIRDVIEFAEDVEWFLDNGRNPKCSVDPKAGTCKKCAKYDRKGRLL